MATGRPDWTTRAQVDLVQVDIDVISRPAYYDRAPANTLAAYHADSVAPHAATVRDTYTVPTGRRAYIDSARAEMLNANPAGGGGQAFCVVNLNSGAIGTNLIVEAWLDRTGTGALFHDREQASAVGLLVAGDVVRIITRDTAGTGAVSYRAHAKICAFDL